MENLEVVTLYKTSLGIFLTKDEAEKKKNRQRTNDRGHDMGLESVLEVRALRVTNNFGAAKTVQHYEYFMLDPITFR